MTSEEFKALRKQLGKTQAEMAKMLGVSQEMLSQIESGKRGVTPDIANQLGSMGLFASGGGQ